MGGGVYAIIQLPPSFFSCMSPSSETADLKPWHRISVLSIEMVQSVSSVVSPGATCLNHDGSNPYSVFALLASFL